MKTRYLLPLIGVFALGSTLAGCKDEKKAETPPPAKADPAKPAAAKPDAAKPDAAKPEAPKN